MEGRTTEKNPRRQKGALRYVPPPKVSIPPSALVVGLTPVGGLAAASTLVRVARGEGEGIICMQPKGIKLGLAWKALLGQLGRQTRCA